MSVRRQALKYTVAAIAVAAVIIVSSTLFLNGSLGSGQQAGSQAKLVIQLTDPPIVPRGTSSLNLSYSSLALLVGEPASGAKQTPKTVTVTSSGTLDLLKLQNVSQTIASANLPNGSVIYSFTFTVSGISIDVNGTKSPVTLATGGSTLAVTLATPSPIEGTDVALLQLNPVIVSTPGGFQMIPSAVGIVRAEGQGQLNEDQVGYRQQLTNEDMGRLGQVQGSLTATLTALSVSGNTTTLTVQVQNSGNSSVFLNAIGIHGNFTASGVSCSSAGSESGSQHQPQMNETEGQDHAMTSTTTTSEGTSNEMGCGMQHMDEVVFSPVNSTVTGTSCVPAKMELVNGDLPEGSGHGLTLAKGQCVALTFSGKISFGESGFVLTPSTSSGQAYRVHVIASEGANLQISCALPLTTSSCSVTHGTDE